MESSFLTDTAVYLASAVVAVPLFKRLGLGSVLGYLAAGATLGPWALGLVKDPSRTMHFAELGVVLLLFLLGLELKPSRLWNMRYAVFLLGGAQVGVSTLALGSVASFFGFNLSQSLIVGFCLSLSSTAFALQILAERKQLNTAFGRSAFAILLFQDLIAIPVLALLPVLGSTGLAQNESGLWSVVKALLAIVSIVLGGRFAIRPIFRAVSSADSREVFSAAALLVVLAVALVMNSIGLSMALGAFLVGIVLSDSEYRHLLEADIEPFKGLLLGLFFISVGTSVDFGLLRENFTLLAGAVFLLVGVKYLVAFVVSRAAKLSGPAAREIASVLPQGGEFAFVLFAVALSAGLLTEEQSKLLVLVVIGSMVATPFVGMLNRRIFEPLFKAAPPPFDQIPNESPQVIIAGFGRVGQIVARLLRLQNIAFTALERDSEQANAVRKFGAKVYYGDASRLDLLEAAGARRAKYFVLAIDDVETSVKTAALIKEHFPHLRIFARARNRQHAFEFMDLGITEFWRETFASTIELSKSLLLEIGTSLDEVDEIVQKFREHDENALVEQHKLHHDEKAVIQYSKQSVQQLLDTVAADRKPRTEPN